MSGKTPAAGIAAAALPPAAGRRQLRFTSLDEVLAEAGRLVAASDTKMRGNWSLARLLAHLASTIDASIDGISFRVPLWLRWLGPLFKQRAIRSRMPTGFRLPAEAEARAFPEVESSQAALEMLHRAIARLQNERMTARHPVLGKLSHDQWCQIHLRHAELHLGFADAAAGAAEKP